MKKTLMVLTALALLTTSALLRAADTNSTTTGATAKAKPYPLNYCLVSGEKLGGMGAPPSIIYEGQEIKFCCADCPAEFKKNPDKFIKKLAETQKKAAAKTSAN